jgi:uncharacterized membrane protein YidH (DUF202 family)
VLALLGIGFDAQFFGVKMNDFLISLVSLLVGIIASVWASAYYFRKSVRKSLTPYIQFYSSPFIGVADDVKKTLQIFYNGVPVDELFEIQFVIQNTGDKAICNLMEPLSFKVPDNCKLLDAFLLYRDPLELKINLDIQADRTSFAIDFRLLNSRDYFVLKILLDGAPEVDELRFSILVDELPPTLNVVQLNPAAVATPTKKSIEFSLLGGGLLLLFFGLVLLALTYNSWPISASGANKSDYVLQFTSKGLLAILAAVPALVLTMVGAMVSALAVFSGRYPFAKSKFVLPEGLDRPHWRLFTRNFHSEPSEISPSHKRKA